MATTSKQFKAIGEDLWKGKTEKIVRLLLPVGIRVPLCAPYVHSFIPAECGIIRVYVWCTSSAIDSRL